MVLVRTNLGETRDDARHERFEQIPGNAATNVQDAIRLGSGGGGRNQRSLTVTGPILFTDSILNLNAAGDMALTLPLASSRIGVPLTFKVHPGSGLQTISCSGGDTMDGTQFRQLTAGQSITLVPYNDGVNSGYAIE